MTKQEFMDRIGEKFLPDREWDVIQFVYTWHPSIDEVDGKNQIATIYKVGGYRVIKDMMPTAQKCLELDEKIRKAEDELTLLRKAKMAVAMGGTYEEDK